MRKAMLQVAVLVAALLFGAISSGCSEEEQSSVAAEIGNQEIKRSFVERWARFESEIRGEMSLLRPKSEEEIETTALESLVQAQWIREEAVSRGISIGRSEREAAVRNLKHRIGLYSWAIERARSSAGISVRAFEARAVAAALAEELVGEEAIPRISPSALRRYYQANGWELGEPEQRVFRFLLTPSQGDAIRGKRALEDGEDWEEVAERYSHPEALSRLGWRRPEVTHADIRELLNAELADEAFAARPYEVQGPRRLEEGWIVWEVTEVTPPFHPSFRLARQAVRNRLLQQRQEHARSSLERRLRAKYGDQTRCAEDFDISWCRPLSQSGD